MSEILKLILLALTATALTACYKMPGDDDYSLVPSTNNPEIYRDNRVDWSPGGAF